MIFVEEMLVEETEFATNVPVWRLPEPVALVKVRAVLLTVEARKNPVPFVRSSVEPVAFVNVRPVVEATLVA